MSGSNRRLRPSVLAALTIVIIAASLVSVAAGVRLAIQGNGAPPVARVVASDVGVAHHHPRPALTAAAAPAVHRPKLASSRIQLPRHPRRHSPGPKRHRPARHQRPSGRPIEQAPNRQRPQSPALMLLDHAVLDMQAAGAGRTLLRFMDQPQNLVSTPRHKVKPLRSATRIQVFNSYANIAKAVAGHRIARDTRAIVYDNELSTGTPAAELQNPVRYCRLTAQLLHRNGLKYIASPGFDLSGPRPANGEWFEQFAQAGLMRCGRYADYLDIQDQLMEGTPTYAKDAKAAATLLHHINPRAKLLMGLSTSPSGQLHTAGQLWQAYRDTNRFANGYWLNVPHNVSGHSLPSVALQFLQKVVTRTR